MHAMLARLARVRVNMSACVGFAMAEANGLRSRVCRQGIKQAICVEAPEAGCRNGLPRLGFGHG